MKESQSLKFAGDVSIDKVQIITSEGFYQDIAAQVINIQYYEDLFSPFISGSLVVKDSLDLVNLFPFVGEEYLELEVSTPSLTRGNIKGRYYIYKLSDRELLGDRSVVYQLHFISVEAIIDMNKKISKTFSGNVGKMVDYFVKDKVDGLQSDKKVYVEETIKDTKFISNFWSPVKCITYLSETAVNREQSPSYLFFENRDGFYFITLNSLYGTQMYQEFTYDKYTRDNNPGAGSVRNINEEYKRISSISIPTGFDYIDRIKSGMLSSKMISWDQTNKSYAVKNYNMFDRFDKQNHLNKYPLSSSRSIFRSNSLIINFPRAFANFAGFGDVTNYSTIQERLSLMKLAEANKIEITVPGRTDYTVGQKVGIILNKIEPIKSEEDDVVDKMFSGYYLISAVNHYITRESHECHMELIKDSLQMNLDRKK